MGLEEAYIGEKSTLAQCMGLGILPSKLKKIFILLQGFKTPITEQINKQSLADNYRNDEAKKSGMVEKIGS